MLRRGHRFHGHNALNFTYQRGRSVRGSGMTLRYIDNPRRRSYRVAVVVSKKVSKSAVVRNRIRRRIYEVIRLHITNDAPPYDIIVSVHSAQLALMPAAELQALVVGRLRQAGAVV